MSSNNLANAFGKMSVENSEGVNGWGGEEKNNSKRFKGGRKHRKTHKRHHHSKRRHSKRRHTRRH